MDRTIPGSPVSALRRRVVRWQALFADLPAAARTLSRPGLKKDFAANRGRRPEMGERL